VDIESAALAQIAVKEAIDLGQKAGALPKEVPAVAGRVGGVSGRHVIPGGAGGEFPEDAFEDEALVHYGAAARRWGRRREEGPDEGPLFIGEAEHDF
jgi:hypothetical protein